MSRKIFFVTGNANKVFEMQKLIDSSNINIRIKQIVGNIDEIKSENTEKVALNKTKTCYAKYKIPLFCEDIGIFIESLNNFPGANA